MGIALLLFAVMLLPHWNLPPATIDSGSCTILTESLPLAFPGSSYYGHVENTGCTGNTTWEIDGAVPPGITFHANGSFLGIPQKEGDYPFRIQIEDAAGSRDAKNLTISVLWIGPRDCMPVPSAMPPGKVGETYQFTVRANEYCVPPLEWWVSDRKLPEGLSLNASNGTIRGIPSQPGAYLFVLTVMDSRTGGGGMGYTIVVNESEPRPPTPNLSLSPRDLFGILMVSAVVTVLILTIAILFRLRKGKRVVRSRSAKR